ncbi:MAG: hypothetical protein RL677_886 [Actinomycetota bacterium]
MRTEIKESDGLSGISWESSNREAGNNWLVVLGNSETSKPRIYHLDKNGKITKKARTPFNSLILKRFKQLRFLQTKRVLRFLSNSVLITALISVVVVFVIGVVQLRLVVSDSMSGTFEKGDLLLIVDDRFNEPQIGSIIVFHYYNIDRSEVVGDFSHRIIAGDKESGWQTKGDANEDADLSPVLEKDIVGVVAQVIPEVGNLFQPRLLLALMNVILFAAIAGPEAKEILRRRRR